MRRIITFFVTLFVLSVTLAQGQTRQVTGRVMSAEDNQPIIGANIFVKEAPSVGTTTDADGHYTLKGIPAKGKILVFSFIGYVSVEMPISGNVINASLKSEFKRIDEVVVTALGITREKKALGYSVQDVKSEDLTKGSSPSLATALQGKVAGVDVATSSGMPGASAKITIRGSRSFTGDNTPLYVVDGLPISSSADVGTGDSVSGTDFANRSVDIDPNDIESINVLKGQAASALYGMRASNGVIIITTKSGRGAAKGKPIITINSNVSFDVISVMPKLQKEFAQGSDGLYDPTASTSWGPEISELPNDSQFDNGGKQVGYGGNLKTKWNNYDNRNTMGKYYVPQRLNAGLDPWTTPQVYNNAKDFFNTGVTWSNSVNVIQNLEKGSYSFSLGNLKSNGIVPTTGMERYNAKISAETKLNNNWSTGFTGNYIRSNIDKQSSANNSVVATVYPAPPSYDLKGISSHYDGDPYRQNTYRSTAGFDGAYWAIDNNKFAEKSHRFFGNGFIKYSTKFNSDNQKLDVKYQLGTDSYTTNYTDLWGYGHANGLGSIEQYGYTINEVNSLLTATYNWNINETLSLDAILGNEFVDKSKKYVDAFGQNFNFSGWNHMDNASVYKSSESETRSRTVGVFGSLSLAYKNMLYLSATGRNDIVSTMPRNNRSFFYPSVSLGWILSEIDAFRNDILTYSKIRLSYAEVGQAGIYYDSYYATPVYGGGFSSGTPLLYPISGKVAFTPYYTVYDPNLKPQNTRSYEGGIDLGFYNGLLTVGYTFSRQNVKDQIFPVPLAGSTGSTQLITNGGSIHTNAHELTVSVAPVRKRNVKWDFGFNFSKINNYVDKLAPGVTSIFLGGFVEPQVRAGIGYKYPVIYGVSYLRNKQGQIVVDSRGFPQAGEEKVIGNVSPDFTLSFNSNLEIYKVKISALLDWKQGGQMYSGTLGLLDYYGISQNSADLRKSKGFIFGKNSVKVTGVDSQGNETYAKNDILIDGRDAQGYFDNLNSISESMIFDNSFVKLRELSLSYPVFNKKGVDVTINAFARNILLWSSLRGLDPEASQGNTNIAGAFERLSLPGTSSYGFGINLKF